MFNIYRIIFQRTPKPAELQFATDFVNSEIKYQQEVEATSKTVIEKANKKIATAMKANEADANRRQATIHNKDSGFIERKSLTPWETLVHSLLMSNEVVYIN